MKYQKNNHYIKTKTLTKRETTDYTDFTDLEKKQRERRAIRKPGERQRDLLSGA